MTRLTWLTFIILMLVTSCQKQSPDEIQPDYTDSLSEVRRGEACSRTSLLDDILYLENLKNLFVCTTWEEDFPQMYKSLLQIDEEAWDNMVRPINNFIANNREVRDELIAIFSDLDRKGGLEDFSRILLSFSDSNFFSHFSQILNCPEEGCPQGLTQEDLIHFLSFFKLEKKEFERLSKISGGTSLSFKGEGKTLVDSFKVHLRRGPFVLVRNAFLNAFFKGMEAPRFREDLSFYFNVIKESEEGELGWLPHFIKGDADKGDVVEILRFPIDQQPEMWKDFRLLKEMLRLTLPCEIGGKGNQFTVIIRDHLNFFVETLFKGSREEFLDQSMQSVLLLKGAALVCPNLQNFETNIPSVGGGRLRHSLNFVESLEETSLFLNKSENYFFVKNLNESYPQSRADNLYIIDYFSTDTFATAMNILRETGPGENSFTGAVVDFLRGTPGEAFSEASKMLKWALEKEPQSLAAIAKVWNELGEDGRYFLFNVLDSHFQKETRVTLLFDFYTALLQVGSGPFGKITAEWFEKDKVKGTLAGFKKIFPYLGRDELLNEYQDFFSRDHIIAIIKLLSTGRISPDQRSSLEDYFVEEDGGQLNQSLFLETIEENKRSACLKAISSKERPFYVLLNKLPEKCSWNQGEDPLFDLFYSINDFSSFMEEERGAPYPIGDRAVFSPESIRFVTSLLKVVDSEFNFFKILDSLNEWIEYGPNKKSFKEALTFFNVLLDKESSLIDTFFSYFSSSQNFNYLNELSAGFSQSLKDYSAYKRDKFPLGKLSFSKDEDYSCDAFHADIGSRACPSKKELLTLYKRGLFFLKKENDKNPTALEQLLRLVASDYGLLIPYEDSNGRYKRVTLRESFEIFYELTDKGKELNNLRIEYNPVPLAVDDYFANENWEVTSRMGRAAPDERAVNVTTLERVETVIRDVRFDKNYLGAHYLNAVAKAKDYNEVVDSKYGLLKTCVPLKFCGKFMNKGQHKLAKNSKETFKALLDVNTQNEWRFGDYMQALLMSLVSSSPDKSQVSSVIRRRFLGINLNIPWLQSKEDLEFHNGQILGLVSMVNGFTNAARLIRDRVGRSERDFSTFINGKRINKFDKNLLKNFQVKTDLPRVRNLLEAIEKTGFLNSFLTYYEEADYETTRLSEGLIYKLFYLTSFISDSDYGLDKGRYAKLSFFGLLDILNPLLKYHSLISDELDLRDKDNLRVLNRVLDVLLYRLDSEGAQGKIYARGLNELILFLSDKNKVVTMNLEKILEDEKKAHLFLSGMGKIADLYGRLMETDSIDPLTEKIDYLINDQALDWTPIERLLSVSSAKRYCTSEPHLLCTKNKQKGELREFLRFLSADEGARLIRFFRYPKDTNSEKIKSLIQRIFPSLILEPRS